MNWIILIIAGILEVAWAIGLKYTHGFTRLVPTVLTLISIVLSMGLLGIAMNSIPVGTAYAVWVGIGIIGTAICGAFLFDEPANILRIISFLVIIVGIVGLKFTTPT
ncbi:MAG: quaternary ammonium compound efflux SMR transporter SugE [Lentisphaerae bacterium]|nr:quaternary ammonium compound efflux SMR transporter SugE [Lentisphaerota bacterium]